MSPHDPKSKSFFKRIAPPVALTLLVGMGVGYAVRSGESNDRQAVGSESLSHHQHADARGADAGSFAPSASAGTKTPGVYRAEVADPKGMLAQLHASMTITDAQRDAGKRQVMEMERQHAAEPVDSAWSAQSELRVASASSSKVMVQAGFSPKGMATDCRSKTCRISARFSSSLDAQDWSDRLLTQMGPTISQAKVTVVPQPDGSFEVRIYGARKTG